MNGWLDEIADQARRAMPRAMTTYVEAGAREEVTLREAGTAWRAHRFRPRVLRDVSTTSVATTLLGQPVATPIAVAPTSMQRAAHPEGERGMAAGAGRAGALHVVSSNTGTALRDLGVSGPWWLQLYIPAERTQVEGLLHDAREAGASAIVLTVDTPVPGTKYAVTDADWSDVDLSWHRARLPATDQPWSQQLTAETLAWLVAAAQLPVVVKGVLRGDDALRCLDAGAAAIYVSNHGGRQLDRSIPTAVALPEVVEAVGSRAQVYVDGGIRSGLDALTALALGAHGVFVGRPALWGLATDGSDGVFEVLEALTEELVEGMRLAGCATLGDTRGIVAGPKQDPL